MLRGLGFLIVVATALLSWRFFELNVPCAQPITYSLGSFDQRFGLKQDDFLKALTEAEKVWEASIGIDLFSYAPDRGELSVNLVYDYRQEATQELSVIEGKVEEGEEDYRALESQYTSLKSEYNTLKSAYDAGVSSFSQHNSTYEAHLEEWNSGPRTSRREFEALEKERHALEAEAEELKTTESTLNARVREINALVVRLNTLAKKLNLNVRDYNAIGVARGETFAGGTYTHDDTGERIDIFEFRNHDKLVRVLAHELGHALGLEHIPDPHAIMYEFNEGDRGTLSVDDLTALKTLCGVK